MRTHALTSLRLALLASITVSPGCGGRALESTGETSRQMDETQGPATSNVPSGASTDSPTMTGPAPSTPTTPSDDPSEPAPTEPSIPVVNLVEPGPAPTTPMDAPVEPNRVPPATACTGSTPIEADTGVLGIEQCEDGLVHRVAPAECTVLPPRADFSIPEGFDGDCLEDAECTEFPYGWCALDGQVGWGTCHYGCKTDADCGDSQVCECGAVAGQCVDATCVTDADCADGELCAQVIDAGMCSDGSGGPTAYACTQPADECHQTMDCGEDGRCSLVEGVAVCSERSLCGIGRPFLVQGQARLADPASRADYVDGAVIERCDTLDALSASERERLAEYWTRIGLMEHASVAAFARFSLELLSLGAPPTLVAESNAAMADELRHAQACFALASNYASADIGPGPLPVADALGRVELEDIFVDVFLEGCVGETVAAIEAAEARTAASNSAVRSVLDVVRVDESRHAALAWKFVRWALAQDARLYGVLQGLHDDQCAAARRHPVEGTPRSVETRLATHGYVDDRTRSELRAQVIEQVVAPCCRALLGTRRVEAGSGRRVAA